jgi:Domain of unknown function (DUF4384)
MKRVFQRTSIARMLATSILGLGVICAISFNSTVMAQSQDEASRQIVLDRFNKARPAAGPAVMVAPPRIGIRPPSASASVRPPVYRRTGALRVNPGTKRKPARGSFDDIGVTVWRLRPGRSSDEGARVLVLDGLKQEQWTPERVEADTPLNIGDRVRLSIESPRPGYLYIIDREQYADGSLGEAILIFPTLNTRGGDNRVEPGRLIDIPAQEDQYSYFTAQHAGDRRDQIAEVLTIILTPAPLPFKITDQPLRISAGEIAGWEKSWGGVMERLELVGGAGRTWTNEEKAAGALRGQRLTQTGPAPQTVYRLVAKRAGTLLVTLPLRYGR